MLVCYCQVKLLECGTGCNPFSSQEGLECTHMVFMCKCLQLLHSHLDLCECHPCAGECNSYALLLGASSVRSNAPLFGFPVASQSSKLAVIVAATTLSEKKHVHALTVGACWRFYCSVLLHWFCFLARQWNTRTLHLASITSLISS